MAEMPMPSEGIVLTHFIVSADVPRSVAFYSEVLGGEVVLEAPTDPNKVSAFLNIRVADIQRVYEEWSSKGAEFITPPQQRETEIRCYVRDPDGHLIEVGQRTAMPGDQ